MKSLELYEATLYLPEEEEPETHYIAAPSLLDAVKSIMSRFPGAHCSELDYLGGITVADGESPE